MFLAPRSPEDRRSARQPATDQTDATEDQIAKFALLAGIGKNPVGLLFAALALHGDQRIGDCFGISRRPLLFLLLVAGERPGDGGLVKDGNRCAAMTAGGLVADIDRCATTGTADGTDADGKRLDFCRTQLPHEALLDHELRKSDKAPMLLQTAVVIEMTAATDVLDWNQRIVATRAKELCRQGLTGIVAVYVDQLEKVDDAARRDLESLVGVAPQALAVETQIKLDRSRGPLGQIEHTHRLAAGRAGTGGALWGIHEHHRRGELPQILPFQA